MQAILSGATLTPFPLGVDFPYQIDAGMEKSHSLWSVISPHSVNSPCCAQEIIRAFHYQKRIITLLHFDIAKLPSR